MPAGAACLPGSISQTGRRAYSRTGSNLADRALEQILHSRSDASPISKWNQSHDNGGQVTSWTRQIEAGNTRTFSPVYDQANQLTGVTASTPPFTYTYAYDNAGNRVSESIAGSSTASTFNSLDQLVSIDPAANAVQTRDFSWDGAGRQSP